MKTIFKNTYANALKDGGAKQDRTADLLRARQALSQLSYRILTLIIALSYLARPSLFQFYLARFSKA